MCDIAGFFSTALVSAEHLISMTTLARHRGPDDEGYVVFRGMGEPAAVHGGVDTFAGCYTSGLPYLPKKPLSGNDQVLIGLGHRRLSIIDLTEAGHQPMCSSDGRYWIVYNGEIYNYLELREELKDHGHAFHSQSDTEVILSAWDCWGQQCLDRLNGMFAFTLYDTLTQTVFFVRDRFGVKPFYYWISPAGFIAFASEIKQFSVLPGWDPHLNGQLTYDYLIWGLIDHTQETLFKGVYQLRPGNLIRIDLRKLMNEKVQQANEPLRSFPWYTLMPQKFDGTLEEAAGRFLDIFQDAVSLRMRSDVPVGSCLSGGLDSSSIVCLLNRLLKGNSSAVHQKSFSACSHDRQFDEREYIDEVVKHTGLDAHYVYPSLDDLFETMEDIIWHQDEPFGSASIYAQWNVFSLASRNGVKVMLDGQGADEYLAGYHTFFAVRQASLLSRCRFFSFLTDVRATSRLHNYTLLKSARDTASLLLPAWQRKLLSRVFQSAELDPSWLNLHLINARARNPLSSDGKKPGSVRDLSVNQLTASTLPMLLHWEDRNSMASSLEARVPFLDYRLVEFTLGLPEELKLKNGITKRVLREAMRGILPEKIRLRRDKIGFATPEQTWMKKENPGKFKMMLRDSIEYSRGILSDPVLHVLNEMIDDQRPFSFLIWRLICFGKWLRLFNISI